MEGYIPKTLEEYINIYIVSKYKLKEKYKIIQGYNKFHNSNYVIIESDINKILDAILSRKEITKFYDFVSDRITKSYPSWDINSY